MRRLTLCQRLVLLATLIIALNGILRSPVFDEPEEGVGNMSKNKVRLEASIAMGCEVSRQQCADWQRKAALWEKHQWRAQVHLVRERIWSGWDQRMAESRKDVWLTSGVGDAQAEYLARAFVRTARELKLPLKLLVAVADVESKFDQQAVGKQGEVSLMQILPLKGRPMEKIKADPAFAIRWAMEALFAPTYHKDGLEAALLYYNGGPEGHKKRASRAYAIKVMALGAQMVKEDALWEMIPQ